MYELSPGAYEHARPLFADLDYHLAAVAVLAGDAPGQVYVDNLTEPRIALTCCGGRLHLAGTPLKGMEDSATIADLRCLFTETIYPQARLAGRPLFTLAYAPLAWEQVLVTQVLAGQYPLRDERHCYGRHLAFGESPETGPAPLDGMALRAVDRALLAETRVQHLNELREEMCSERPSVEEFLSKSFGVCLVRGDELVGWCLSEYNSAGRCEVGTATREGYRRQGLGTLMARALIGQARAREINRVGWHCYASNLPSIATARKAGFVLEREYPVLFAGFDPLDNLAVHGNVYLHRGDYVGALDWFERAFAAGATQGWACWGAARAAAMLSQHEAAWRYLEQAVERGGVGPKQLRDSPHLVALHGSPAWQALLARLN